MLWFWFQYTPLLLANLQISTTCHTKHTITFTGLKVLNLCIRSKCYFIMKFSLHRHSVFKSLILFFCSASFSPFFFIRLRQNFLKFWLSRCRYLLISLYYTFPDFFSFASIRICLAYIYSWGQSSFTRKHSYHLELIMLRSTLDQINFI